MAIPDLISRVHPWNGWDRFPGGRPFPRREKRQAIDKLKSSPGLLLKGCRGVGKSTLLKMLAMDFHSNGIPRESIVFLDLEDPRWALSLDMTDLLSLLSNDKTKLLVLDGVERLTGWHRVFKESIRRKITTIASITGDKDSLEGMELIKILPMNLASWLEIFTDKKVDTGSAESYMSKYLNAGGLPVSRHAGGRRLALIEVFYSSLLKDVLLLKSVRSPEVLTAMAVYLLGMTGRPISAARLRGSISRSMDQARMLLGHLAESGLISLVSRLEDAGRSSNQAARLVFACDTGLAVAVSQKLSVENPVDNYYLALTAVYHRLSRMGQDVWAWRHLNRHGLLLGDGGGHPELMIDLQLEKGQEDDRTLRAVMARYGCKNGLLLSSGTSRDSAQIKAEPLWRWMMKENTDISNNKLPTDKTMKNQTRKQNKLPRHLL